MSLTANQLRQLYLDYMQERGHTIVPSRSLVPKDDPTTLFTSAGMQWMLPYLLGAEHPMGTRVANSQKCLRAEDIEEVGDNRHTTFFEMLGNWSFGDYFRKNQLTWFFEFLVKEVGLDPQRLYVTAFKGSERYGIPRDTETISIWQELFAQYDIEAGVIEDPEQQGLTSGRIFLYTWENWWSRAGEPNNMPVGEPGGPDSEVFYDFGTDLNLHQQSEFADQPCHVNCDCGRFLEIGNSVFMQFQKTEQGFKPLDQKNIDFGGGLERILAASSNQLDIFQTDFFWPIIKKIEQLSEKEYQQSKLSFRIIADHIKAAVMLAADGVQPSNKERGYMVRRLIRRAIRHSKLLGAESGLVSQLTDTIAALYQDHYPQLAEKVDQIQETIRTESDRFEKTIETGLREFDKAVERREELTGKLAFKLYQTYGFPIEMSIEEAERRELPIDSELQAQFEQAKQKHIEKSRQGAAQKFSGGLADQSDATTQYHTATHLIHAALRQVLGNHVEQQGSNITRKRLRFDFSHPEALSSEQLQQIEKLVNQWIDQNLPVVKQTMDRQQALDSGALAVFAERYPPEVDVYTIKAENSKDWVSRELCGGPHVSSTKEIEPIEIYKEKSAGAGVRRIYARHHRSS